jgi:peptidoglycan/LPS O-acetylase OafA/YrhL
MSEMNGMALSVEQTPIGNPTISQPYRPAIDGLRALAVLAVVVFHLEETWLPGGFIGVDVFFVISGFLITNLILRDCSENRFSFSRFYQRRIARLFPSMFLVLIVTFSISCLIYDPRFIADSARHMVEAALSVANISNEHEAGGYFGIAKDVHPFLHFWSLSVEEQFYIFFPTTLLLLRRFAKKRVTTALSILLLVSLVACMMVTPRNANWAFYMLPTRAWELLTGAVLASAQFQRRDVVLPNVYRLAGLLGILLLAISVVFVRSSNFPGYLAILPVAATAAILAGSASATDWLERFLSWTPLVLIGRVSYTLYLWHLPIFCLIDYKLYNSSGALRIALKLVLTAIAASVTWYFIENPARLYLNQRQNRWRAFSFAACMLCLTVPIGIYCRVKEWPEPKTWMIRSGGIGLNQGGQHGSIVLMGDSEACSLGTMIQDLAHEKGMRLNILCASSTDPLAGGRGIEWSASLAAVERLKPDFLIIDMAWTGKVKTLQPRLATALQQLGPYAKNIVLVSQPPRLPENATREGIRTGVHPPFIEDADYRASRQATALILRSEVSKHVMVINTEPYFEAADGSIEFTDANGHQLFFDPMHLSRVGADRLKPEFNSLITPSQ